MKQPLEANRKGEWDKHHLSNCWSLPSLACWWMASLLQFISRLLVAVDFGEGRNPMGCTPGAFCQQAPQPPENLLSYNWDAATQNTGGRAEQRRSVRSHVICSAFMLHLLSFCCGHKTGTGWHFDALKIRESKLWIASDAVHVGILWRACCTCTCCTVLYFYI